MAQMQFLFDCTRAQAIASPIALCMVTSSGAVGPQLGSHSASAQSLLLHRNIECAPSSMTYENMYFLAPTGPGNNTYNGLDLKLVPRLRD